MAIDLTSYRTHRRRLIGQGAALGVGLAATGVLSGRVVAQEATSTSGTDARLNAIVDAATAFVATLSEDERAAVRFEWSDDGQKARWSNFPEGLFERDGLMWGNLATEAQDAWLALMQATLSDAGYARVIAAWEADQFIADNDGPWGGGAGNGGGPAGGGMQYGTAYYWIALIGEPSATEPWQWQFGGHHITVNATVTASGIALTPSFIGVQPATYTDAEGTEVQALGDVRDAALALVTALDAGQQADAILGSQFIDLVLGPGADGETMPDEGLVTAEMGQEQQALAIELISRYTGLLNEDHAAARLAEVTDVLDQTRFAWYGPTDGSAAYFRVAGPTIVIEYSPQNQLTDDPAEHIHGIYRDPSNDYGTRYIG